MEELLARHKKEQRDLQGRITQKKKNSTKKTRKGVNDECAALEREVKERQQAEVDALNPGSVEERVEHMHLDDGFHGSQGLTSNGDIAKKVSFAEGARGGSQEVVAQPDQQPKKPNRQKARLARRAAEQEAQVAAAADEAANLPDLRDQEMSAMKKEIEKRGLVETSIRPDGHCLYSACAHSMATVQLKASGPYSEPYQNMRLKTAEFMTKHPDDFAAFMEEPLENYVKKIKDTAEWGGQLELQAIARGYDVRVNVLQADGKVEKFDPEHEKGCEDVWLAYYRHSFGLGEHYNALRKSDKT